MVTYIDGTRVGKVHNSGDRHRGTRGNADGPTRTQRRRSTKSIDRNKKRGKR